MKKRIVGCALVLASIAATCFAQAPGGVSQPAGWGALGQAFDFSAARSVSDQYFTMETRMVTHGPDGRAVDTTTLRTRLRCEPGAGAPGDRYTCLRFTFQRGEGPETAIPSLAGWQYVFTHRPGEKDEKGQTLGIDHAPFEKLVDERGVAVPAGIAYLVYNVFIDFHSFQAFTDPTPAGGGIQDLTRIGQKVVHAASHSRPSTDLGSAVANGSYFENGEVTLELKGVSLERGKACAVVGYDSGASSFVMLVKPMPDLEVRTTGSSHYWGDIYKDLDTRWVRRASLTELVVSETLVPGQKPLDAVTERAIQVLNVPRETALAALSAR